MEDPITKVKRLAQEVLERGHWTSASDGSAVWEYTPPEQPIPTEEEPEPAFVSGPIDELFEAISNL